MRHILFGIGLVLALSLQGCGTISDTQRSNALDQTLKTYGETVRWGHLSSAYGMLEPALTVNLKVPENLDSVRVVRYEVLEPPIQLTEETASQTVAIDYVFLDRQVVRTLVDRQLWVFDKETGVWRRGNAIPEYR